MRSIVRVMNGVELLWCSDVGWCLGIVLRCEALLWCSTVGLSTGIVM